MTQHREDQLVQILNQCCELIAAGESVSACLEHFPEHSVELAPLLATTTALSKLRLVPARPETLALERRAQFMTSAVETSRFVKNRPAGLLAALALWWNKSLSGLREVLGTRGIPRAMPVGLMAALVVVILFGTLATGAVTASATAIPGDPLYPVKAIAERARILLERDPQARDALEDQIAGTHLEEIRSVVQLLRRVDRMPLVGVIEEIKPDEWSVSGLHLLILPDTVIQGVPQVGAGVSGTVRAPGDGTLIAVLLAVEPVPAAAMPPTATPTPTPTATFTGAPTSTRRPPTRAPTWTPTGTPQPTSTDDDPVLKHTMLRDTATPVAVRTATRTRTPVSTKTVTPTREPTATWTPGLTEPTAEMRKHIIDWVRRREGSRWTIGEITVDTDAETEYIGDPDVGSLVEANLLVRSDGSYLAELIKELGGKDATPEPYDFTGVVEAIAGDRWTVKGTTVRIDGDTQTDDGIQVGDYVTVAAERRSGGEIWAREIRKVEPKLRQFSGRVESINDSTWTVGSYSFTVTGETDITGNPGVGDYVDVEALEYPDGRVEATSIFLVPDTPVPPTATDTPAPPTAEPPTAEPPTAEPPTAEPPTAEPPTAEPPTAEPPTAEPPTAEPPTAEPPTTEPPTAEPPTTEPLPPSPEPGNTSTP